MSVQYLGCFPLTRRTGQAKQLQEFLANTGIAFSGSHFRCELTPHRNVACEPMAAREESAYFHDCWEQGEPLNGEFSTEDFFFDLRAVDHRGGRYAVMSIFSNQLSGLMFHLDDRRSDLFKFLAGFEAALTAPRCVFGMDVQLEHLFDFLGGTLTSLQIKEFVKIASQPSESNLPLLRALAFRERAVGPRRYFVHDFAAWRVVFGEEFR